MLSPSHVEALRLGMVERLWKNMRVGGPLPELMCDIMSYIGKPAIAFHCPMQEVLIEAAPNYFFVEDNVIYGVFRTTDSPHLKKLSPPGEPVTLINDCAGYCNTTTYYYDTERGHLYVLHDHRIGSSMPDVLLIDYDVKAGRVHETRHLDALSGLRISPSTMAVVGESIFLGVKLRASSGNAGYSLEVLYVDPEGRVSVVWYNDGKHDGPLHLLPVAASPPTLDVIYVDDGFCHSVRLVMTRSTVPIMFEKSLNKSIPLKANSSVFAQGVSSSFSSPLEPWLHLTAV